MKSIDELVRELADREAIRDLVARYCNCLWRNDLDGVVNLFTDDGTFVVKGIEGEAVSRGRAEIKKTHEKALAETTPRMFVHNQIVSLLGGDRATGRCYVEVRDAKIGMEWPGAGDFEDKYAKVGEQWKFSARHHTLNGIDDKVPLRTFIT